MANAKKRPSKAAKAAQRILSESKLMADAKAADDAKPEQEFRSSQVTPRTSTGIKVRPHKKRG
jgi:hypothetical protein